jgi:lipid-A-disaccharide synthase-like uncharacterized protein
MEAALKESHGSPESRRPWAPQARPRFTWRRMLLNLAAIAIAVTVAGAPQARQDAEAPPPGVKTDTAESVLRLRLKPLPDGVRKVRLESHEQGPSTFVLTMEAGGEERLSPAEFAERLARDHRQRSLAYKLLNITSPVGYAWVLFGLLGQVLFVGRMVFQWVASERQKRSVVPAGFWWLSLLGASMLLVYFIWRRDAVGILGQSTGWLIYVRNLWFIHRTPRATSPNPSP